MSADLPRPFGRYLLLELLGTGATGDAHLARPLDPRSPFPSPLVIKRLHARHAAVEEHVRRFQHEARIAVHVESPNLARVYEAGATGDTYYLAMEHVPGCPLSRVLDELRARKRMISVRSAVELIAGVLRGLDALHTARDPETGAPLGIVHRDVSPKNILVGEDGRARLIDLGLGKSTLQDWRTAAGVVMGTIGYMPPEQVSGERVDHRADIYAAAAVLYELLTLQPYIERDALPAMVKSSLEPKYRPPTAARPELPRALELSLRRALAPKPEDRPASAAELAGALEDAIAGSRSGGEPVTALVSAIFGRELEDARTEVTRLISQTVVDPSPAQSAQSAQSAQTRELEAFVVFAERAAGKTALLPPSKPRSRLPVSLWALIVATLLLIAVVAARVLQMP